MKEIKRKVPPPPLSAGRLIIDICYIIMGNMLIITLNENTAKMLIM